MSIKNPLISDELGDYAPYFDCFDQKLMKKSKQSRTNALYVARWCRKCNNRSYIQVNNVRSALRKGKRPQIECRDCRYEKRIILGNGYVAVQKMGHPNAFSGGRYVLEHRLVMEESLGRYLRPDETVHHINGDKADNRLENLQLRSLYHGKGVALECLDCGSHNVGPVKLK